MSWMKGRVSTTPNPATTPPVQMYNPNQHSSQDWQQPVSNNWYNQNPQPDVNQHQQTNYWQNQYPQQQTPPYHQYQNQYNQQTTQPGYYQQQNYDQNYSNGQPYGYGQENNVYTEPRKAESSDSWNWGWGDEDNSNVQLTGQQNTTSNANSAPPNAVADSFANDESWNWNVEETASKPYSNQEPTSSTVDDKSNLSRKQTDGLFPKVGDLAKKKSNENLQYRVKTENTTENFESISLNQLPPMPTGKRLKNEHLTPQWSIESQVSQESSDDVLPTSESDKSHVFSRSSTISHSPVSGQQTPLEPHNPQYLDQYPLKHDANFETFNRENASSLHENKEILSKIKEEAVIKQDPSPPPATKNQTPPPPMANQTPPLPMKNQTPPPPMKNQTPPPSGAPGGLKNPYKRNVGLSHKAVSQVRGAQTESRAPNSYYMPPFTPAFNQNVNLETVPDNSEQPDVMPASVANPVIRPVNASQPYPENNEVAPINDRNQYLETGQLSDESTNHVSDDNVDPLPPPGLSRMVLGQMEQTESSNLENQVDNEPPPGLSRMVLGQTENSSSGIQMSSPPAGLHRMVPGESSSPETNSRYPNMCLEDDYVSETELNDIGQVPQQSRSATIGADTPPVETPASLNRSETIGSNSDNAQREMNLDGANASDVNGDRRDSIDGQPQNSDIDNLVTSVRDLVVGENTTDSQNVSKSTNDNVRRHDTSESEGDRDRGKSPHDRRDRRYKDDRRDKDRNRDRDRDRYSPDYSRDKRSDRRRNRDRYYEEDTDYFSDKERNRRRDDRDRRDDYDKKYGSLRKDKDKDRRRRDGRDVREGRDPRDIREGRDPRDIREGRDPREVRDPRDVREGRDPRDVREGRDGREYRDGRDARRDYYYGRYEDDYDDPQRSRPSSRSDSMHESYRDRGPEREHRRQDRDRRRHRDQYNHYMQGYGYDPYNPYYQQYQYQYLENLRRTNPQAYAEWFRKYYQQSGSQSGQFSMEDKASVHSGRSSTNDELAKERYLRQNYYGQTSMPHIAGYYREQQSMSGHYGMDDSSVSRPFDYTDSSLNYEDTTVSQRLTPAKFSTAHAKASIKSGHLLKILPHYPIDGQAAVVEINQMQSFLQGDCELKELIDFPGPLVKGVTHKKTIIEYCENKIKNHSLNEEITDPDSYVLMWELLILLLRQNGMVVGTDIAELLMKDRSNDHDLRPPSVTSTNSGVADTSESNFVGALDATSGNNIGSGLKEEYVTNKFREYLLYGSGKEALEWAMKNSLWGHALFLASKLDKRTYANVMMRFANGLPLNDPLQTLYQLLSGRLPASVTSVCDDKWGDWRPHLAMILSNTTQRPELDRKAITTLADTLMARGSLYAAQFCYLMAEVGFSRYGSEGAKLVLLGSHHGKPFRQFATNEAIHMTEVYEYACSLNESAFIIPEFQAYKYLVATRLADRGFLENALAYLEQVAASILQNPSAAQPSLITKVCDLADRLKYYDPVVDDDEEETEVDLDSNRPDNTWLKDLKSIQKDYNMGLITHESIANLQSMSSLQEQTQSYDHSPQDPWQSQQQIVEQEQFQQQPHAWQADPQVEQPSGDYAQQETQQEGYINQYSDQSWNQQPWGNNSQPVPDPYSGHNHDQVLTSQEHQPEYWNNAQTEEMPRPQISMPNQSKAPYQDDDNVNGTLSKDSPVKQKQQPKKEDKRTANNGWFGGIWSRLALRPKNQMKLPDDKNPSIVWDQDKKRWVNLEEDGNDAASELKPPPKMADMMQKPIAPPISKPVQSLAPTNVSAPLPNQPNPATVEEVSNKPPSSNMFKMQRNRNLKKSYVDVFNPGGKTGGSAPNLIPSSDVLRTGPSAGPQMNFFIPAPITDPNAPMDFLTPGGSMPMEPNTQPAHQS